MSSVSPPTHAREPRQPPEPAAGSTLARHRQVQRIERPGGGPGGVATISAFIEGDIEAGRVRALFGEDHPDSGYWIVTRPGMLRPSARAFVRWLRRLSDTLSQPIPARPDK